MVFLEMTNNSKIIQNNMLSVLYGEESSSYYGYNYLEVKIYNVETKIVCTANFQIFEVNEIFQRDMSYCGVSFFFVG